MRPGRNEEGHRSRDSGGGELLDGRRTDRGRDDGKEACLVQHHLVPPAIDTRQALSQNAQAGPCGSLSVVEIPDDSGLPEHQRAGGIESTSVNEEIGRLVTLASGVSRIETEFREETVFRGNPWEHFCVESLFSRLSDGFVGRKDGHPGVAVERSADPSSQTDRCENLLDHTLIRRHAWPTRNVAGH